MINFDTDKVFIIMNLHDHSTITRFFLRNYFVSNLVQDSLKLKKLLELHERAKKLSKNCTLKSLPGSA